MARIDRRWFTSAMNERRMSQRKLAKLMGVDPASVHRLFTGKRAMRFDEATQISRLLSVPVADVLRHAGLNLQEGKRAVPIVGHVDGHGEAHLDWHEDAQLVAAPEDLPPSAVAVQMRTASSGWDHYDGWTLFTVPPKEGVPGDAIGRLCLVSLAGKGVVLLRFLRRGYAPGRWNLVNFGTVDIQDAEVDWATPVLHIRP